MKQRAVIVLTYSEDLGPSAVAKLMGISERAVKRYLARARSRLKEELRTNDDKLDIQIRSLVIELVEQRHQGRHSSNSRTRSASLCGGISPAPEGT